MGGERSLVLVRFAAVLKWALHLCPFGNVTFQVCHKRFIIFAELNAGIHRAHEVTSVNSYSTAAFAFCTSCLSVFTAYVAVHAADFTERLATTSKRALDAELVHIFVQSDVLVEGREGRSNVAAYAAGVHR